MSAHPTAYLVLASQRSGSTLLVESLRATGVAGEPREFFQYLPTTSQSPQPRQWFEGVEDESILRLLDPLDEGKPDLAPPEIWRDYIRTVGRTPNGIWGGKLMWNQTPLLLQRAAGLPDRSGDGLLAAIRDVIGSDPVLVHVYRPDVVSQAVSFWRAVQTRVWRGRPDPTRDSRAEYHAGGDRPRRHADARTGEGLARVVRRGGRRADRDLVPRSLAQPHPISSATVLEALGQDPRLAPAPVLERQADQRSDEWVDRYRADAERPACRRLDGSIHLSHNEYPAEREERPAVGPHRIGRVEQRDQLLRETACHCSSVSRLFTGRSAVPVIHSSTGFSPVSSWM